MGAIASIVCYTAILVKNKLGYDDSLDAFGVHGICGIVGALLVGFLAFGPLHPVEGRVEFVVLQRHGRAHAQRLEVLRRDLEPPSPPLAEGLADIEQVVARRRELVPVTASVRRYVLLPISRSRSFSRLRSWSTSTDVTYA